MKNVHLVKQVWEKRPSSKNDMIMATISGIKLAKLVLEIVFMTITAAFNLPLGIHKFSFHSSAGQILEMKRKIITKSSSRKDTSSGQ